MWHPSSGQGPILLLITDPERGWGAWGPPDGSARPMKRSGQQSAALNRKHYIIGTIRPLDRGTDERRSSSITPLIVNFLVFPDHVPPSTWAAQGSSQHFRGGLDGTPCHRIRAPCDWPTWMESGSWKGLTHNNIPRTLLPKGVGQIEGAARAVLQGERKRVRTANRNGRSRGRSLLHGQDMGKTQDHRSVVEQWLAVSGGRGGWRLAVGGG